MKFNDKIRIGDRVKLNLNYCRIWYPGTPFLDFVIEHRDTLFVVNEIKGNFIETSPINAIIENRHMNSMLSIVLDDIIKINKPYKRIIKNLIKEKN